MYEILKKESSEIVRKERKYLMLRIKEQSVAKNCTIEDIKLFIQRLKERTTTIGYELTTGWIIGDEDGEEWEDVSKIIVKIDNSNTVKIDFQNEIKLENFDKILINVESMVKNKYSKQVEINYITRDKSKPKVEYIDFGILGRYKYNRINYETDDEINAEQEDIQIRKVLSDYRFKDALWTIIEKIYNIKKDSLMPLYKVFENKNWEEELRSEITTHLVTVGGYAEFVDTCSINDKDIVKEEILFKLDPNKSPINFDIIHDNILNVVITKNDILSLNFDNVKIFYD